MTKKTTTKSVPKRDGSGKGVGANAGRGCKTPTKKNQRKK